MKRLTVAALLVAFVGLAGEAPAQDKKADPTGTWKWTVEFGGQAREQTLKLKLEGDKLTGTISIRDGEVKIDDGKFKDGELSFTVTREFNEQKFTSKYTGKLTGDTIKGKTEINFGGQAREREWEAKREKK
jgi:hypothetical protein